MIKDSVLIKCESILNDSHKISVVNKSEISINKNFQRNAFNSSGSININSENSFFSFKGKNKKVYLNFLILFIYL